MTVEEIYNKLKQPLLQLQFQGIVRIGDYDIDYQRAQVIGNIIEDWISEWLNAQGIANEHNLGQTAPDFWFDPDNKEHELLEVKCFDYINRGPGFDIANFQSYIREIIDKPYRLHSKYLAIGYGMDIESGLVTIHQVWLKNVWEMCCSSANRPIKVQEKKKVIYNIRPSVWYGNRSNFPTFESMEDFLSAIEQTIYDYNQTRPIAEHWLKNLIESYKNFYGVALNVPRWYDIQDKYRI